MKRIILYRSMMSIAILFMLLIDSGCKKLLDTVPVSTFDEQYVYSNTISATSAVLGVYNKLAGDQAYGSRLSMMYPLDSDEMISLYGTLDDNGIRDLARYNANPTNTLLSAPFIQLYSGIERANGCIKNIPNMELYKNGRDADKKLLGRLYGEALTLRAQFYLELIRNWGDVPAPFIPSIDQKDLFLSKTNRNEIYDKLLEDLKLASDIVPWRNEDGAGTDERITKAAVKGLRARIALYRGGYALRNKSGIVERDGNYLDFYKIARDECFEIMQKRASHTLNPSFESVFKDVIVGGLKDNYGEVIFQVAMGRDFDSKVGYYNGPRFKIAGNAGLLGNAAIKVLPTYFYSFNAVDVRRDVTIAPFITYFDTNIRTANTLIEMNIGKFRVDWLTPGVTSTNQFLGINWPLIRFSDILLMFAEADNELKAAPSAEAILAFEEVRKRGFKGNESQMGITPVTKEGFFNAIVNERFLEFGGEGIRKYDLIRWNLLGPKLIETRDNLTKMRTRVAPYNTLPQTMYFKTASFELVWGNSLYQTTPATRPVGYSSVAWVSSLTAKIIQGVGEAYKPNKGELFPLPQSAIETNRNNLKQDFGY
jgi:hypothetical protein